MFKPLLYSILIAVGGVTADAGPTVSTQYGNILGSQCSSSSALQYRGIPYGLVPNGTRRFTPTQPYTVKYTNYMLNATQPQKSCFQWTSKFNTSTQSEDCLYLDVWTPAGATPNSNLPVKVWIYGGGAVSGSINDAQYHACNIASDSIVVAINYRLGPLGFLAAPTDGVQGNMAVQDLLTGLQWVQSNIGSFGGNASQTMVFGQSEGAQLTFILSTLPSAKGLFNSVITESGGGKDYLSVTDQRVVNLTNQYLGLLNCSTISCFQSKTMPQLYDAYRRLPPGRPWGADGGVNVTSFQAVVDGQVIPARPAAVGTQVPSILGHTTMEATLFVSQWCGTSASTQNYTDFMSYVFGPYAQNVSAKYNYLDAPYNTTSQPQFYAMSAAYTAFAWTCPTYRALLTARNNSIPVWTYQWGEPPACNPNPALGAYHTSELNFVFNNSPCALSSYQQTLTSAVDTAWTNMARSQNPTPQGNAPYGTWPNFYLNAKKAWVVGQTSYNFTVPDDFAICDSFWNGIDQAIVSCGSGT